MKTVTAGLLNANAIAAPKNGAEQDVAKTVARRPLKNAPAPPCFEARVVAAVRVPDPRETSKTPKRFSAMSVTNVVIATRKKGFPNWKPQPAPFPAVCKATTINAKTRKDERTPAV